MSVSDINAVIDQLSHTSVDGGVILSFAGRGLKLDNESDGKLSGDLALQRSKVFLFIYGIICIQSLYGAFSTNPKINSNPKTGTKCNPGHMKMRGPSLQN